MSSVPPNTPPGAPPPGYPPGGGYPPYDPRTQWRIYREQQKAAWRAQREAMRAQRQAARAGYYGGVYAPRVPSVVGPIILIGVGIIAFLVITDRLEAGQFWTWYAHWWPLLLIGAGLALLGEWALDARRKTPVRRGGSFVGLLILLAFLGLGAAGWDHWRGPLRAQFGDQGDDFFNSFGRPEHDLDQKALSATIAANGSVEIHNPRGDISITAGDGPDVQVQAHEVALADSDSDARKIFDTEAAHVTVSGNAVLVKSDGNNSGRINLTITVPKTARVIVNAGRGDLTAAGLGAGINITASHGDVHLSAISGSVQVHSSTDKHDISAHQVDGDLTIDGSCNDLTLSEIKGKVAQTGEILGDVHMENVSGAVHLHTSVTDLQVAELPGDLTLDSDDLRVSQARGQVRIVTHAKDIDLNQIYGDTFVDDTRGEISIEPAGPYSVDAKNGKGDVSVTLPPNASATVSARTRNGDIASDYTMPEVGDGENKVANFRIGSGSAKITLSADVGDLHIKKGSGSQEETSTPSPAPEPNAPHLKTPKPLPPHPVTQ